MYNKENTPVKTQFVVGKQYLDTREEVVVTITGRTACTVSFTFEDKETGWHGEVKRAGLKVSFNGDEYTAGGLVLCYSNSVYNG